MQAGGPSYGVELGRRDGRISTRRSVRHHLPRPDFKLDQLSSMFASHGLTQADLIALSGTMFSFTGHGCTWCGEQGKSYVKKSST